MFRNIFRVAALAAVIASSACNTTPLVPPTAQVAVVQGDTSVDLAFNVVAMAYLKAAPALPPTTKAKVKTLLASAYAAVQAADNAERLGDATTLAAQVQSAESLLAQAKAAFQ